MNMENLVSVLCVIVKDGKILILKRSNKVNGFRGFYGPVTGILEKNEDPESTAYREMEEETGLRKNEIELLKIGNSFSTKRGSKHYVVYPFLFESKSDKIKIDWESDDFKWIQPSEVSNY